MTAQEFATRYPFVFHVAKAGSWPSIEQHGLLSTTALLDLFEITGEEREQLEGRRRTASHTLEDPVHGRVVLRNQVPLSEEKLASCLVDMTPEEWIRLLNGRVFFWLSRPALDRLLGGKEQRDRAHDVIVFDTSRLLERHGGKASLSPINSGSTLYNPARRGWSTFRALPIYDTLEKRSPVELAVAGGVLDARELAVLVEERRGAQLVRTVWQRPN